MSNSTCDSITQNYTETSYRIAWNDEENFISILQPLLAMIQHKLRGNYLYAEEYLLTFLQENRSSLNASEILDLSRHMSACVAHLYIILTSMVLSVIIGFPLVFCTKACYRKDSNPKKHQYRLFTQAVLFTGALIFLLIGCVSSWNVGTKLENFLQRAPRECISIIHVLQKTRKQFKNNCKKLHSTVDVELTKISDLQYIVYRDLINLVDANIGTEYPLFLKKFDSLTQKVQRIADNMGFISIASRKPSSEFVFLCRELHSASYKLVTRFLKVLPRDVIPNDSIFVGAVFPKSYEYPNWSNFYYDLMLLLRVIFPNTNNTMKFVDRMKNSLERTYNGSAKSFIGQINRIRELSSSTCSNISSAIDHVTASKMENNVLNTSQQIVNVTSYSLFYGIGESPYNFLKVIHWLFLLPSAYGFIVLLLFVFASVGACKEIQATTNGNMPAGIYAVRLYKIAVQVSVAILWLMFLVTAILYFVHIPTAVVCGAMKREKLIDRYLDRPNWNNQTWITYTLNKHIPELNTSITIKTLMGKCSENETIFENLNLGNVINVTVNETSRIGHVIEKMQKDYANVVTRQTFTNFGNIQNFISYIDYNYLNASFVLQVENDLAKMENAIRLLQQKFVILNATDSNLQLYLEDVEYLVMHIRRFVEGFREAKLLRDTSQKDMNELISLNDYLKYTTKEKIYRDVNLYLTNISNYGKCFHREMGNFINRSLKRDFGKCNFLPRAYNKMKWLICDYGVEVLNCYWLSLAILSFSILIAAILACRIACYVRGSYKMHVQFLSNCRRYSRRPLETNRIPPVENRK